MKRTVLGLAASVLLCGTVCKATAGPIIGGFDLARGGDFSLKSSSRVAALRADISSAFAGVTFTTTPTLTNGYLGSIDLLFVSSAKGDVSATTPLTAAEKTALTSFVKAGGSALIFAENDTYAGSGSSTANNSFLTPFGLHVTGTLGGFQNAIVTNLSHPVTDGPFGSITSFTTDFPGWFDTLGSSSQLAKLAANGEPALAVIPRGALGPTSGAVVFFSDSSLLADNFRTKDDTDLILNAIAFESTRAAVPEPSTLILLGIGIAGLIGYGRQRRQRAEPAAS